MSIKAILAVVGTFALITAQAQAATVTLDVTASVTSVVSGTKANVGDTFVMSFDIDDQSTDSATSPARGEFAAFVGTRLSLNGTTVLNTSGFTVNTIIFSKGNDDIVQIRNRNDDLFLSLNLNNSFGSWFLPVDVVNDVDQGLAAFVSNFSPGSITSQNSRVILFNPNALSDTFHFEVSSVSLDSVAAIPIPAAFALLATGLIGLGLVGWCKRRAAA